MSISSALMPQECVLCGGNGGATPLCAPCTGALPELPAPRCPVCASPSPQGAACGACQKALPAFDATFALWRYAFPVDKLIQALKYRHYLSLSGFCAMQMLAAPRPTGGVLMPLPLSRERLRERGFNQAIEIARPLARALRLPLSLEDCVRSTDTAPQANLPWKERRANVRGAFECRADLSGKAVIVVDDVMTSGATLDEFARMLKRHGAVRVINWVVARALRE